MCLLSCTKSRAKALSVLLPSAARLASSTYRSRRKPGNWIAHQEHTATQVASPTRPSHLADWTEGLGRRPVGHCPIAIGDILHKRYSILKEMGRGGYSTVWLARDTLQEQYVAVKVGVAGSSHNECTILKELASLPEGPGKTSMVKVLDEFTLNGPSGNHPCYTMAPALTDLNNRLEYTYEVPIFKMRVARALAARLAQAVAYVHASGYAHGGQLHRFSGLT